VRVLLQRVQRASVSVEDDLIGAIGQGLVVLVGIGPDDTESTAREMARRIADLRIFEDDRGRTDRSLIDVGGAALVVSQFTLYADTRRGRRPGFTGAARPDHADRCYRQLVSALIERGIAVEMGRLGAKMAVELVNDGPFTIWLDSESP